MVLSLPKSLSHLFLWVLHDQYFRMVAWSLAIDVASIVSAFMGNSMGKTMYQTGDQQTALVETRQMMASELQAVANNEILQIFENDAQPFERSESFFLSVLPTRSNVHIMYIYII